MSKKNIGHWYGLNKKNLFKERNIKLDETEKKVFIKNLYKIGYKKNLKRVNIKYLKILTTAFQRRFRQELINGIIDKECLIISNKLVKNFK